MFLVGGCLVKFGSSTINGLLKDALSHVKDAVPEPVGDQLENFDLAEFIGTNILHVFFFFSCILIFSLPQAIIMGFYKQRISR